MSDDKPFTATQMQKQADDFWANLAKETRKILDAQPVPTKGRMMWNPETGEFVGGDDER